MKRVIKASHTLKKVPTIFFKEVIDNQEVECDPNTKSGERIKLTLILKNTDATDYQYEVIDKTQQPPKLLLVSDRAKPQTDGTVHFNAILIMYYKFEMKQLLQFKIKRNVEGEISTMEFPVVLGNVVGSPNSTLKGKVSERDFEEFEISAVAVSNSNEYVEFEFDVYTKGNLSIEQNKFYYSIENKTRLYQSEAVSNTAKFNTTLIPLYLLTPDFQIIFQNFSHTPIASFTTSVNELINANDDNLVETIPFPVTEEISVELRNKTKLKRKYSFVEYLRNGVQIGLSIAIDYTGSNGTPSQSTSLHYTANGNVNDYESAIVSCGSVVSYYDYDQKFPVFGFGGNPKKMVGNKMCFHLNEEEDPEIHTIEEVRNIYRTKTPTISLSWPTEFGPVLKKLIDMVKKENDFKKYNIMMILTDGQIGDMATTKSLLVQASKLPISIIIVGVGNANFDNMNELDSDGSLLKDNKGNQCIRDIVQFVPFNEYRSGERLAQAVLEEIPDQIVDYYKYLKLSPNDLDKYNY